MGSGRWPLHCSKRPKVGLAPPVWAQNGQKRAQLRVVHAHQVRRACYDRRGTFEIPSSGLRWSVWGFLGPWAPFRALGKQDLARSGATWPELQPLGYCFRELGCEPPLWGVSHLRIVQQHMWVRVVVLVSGFGFLGECHATYLPRRETPCLPK